MTDENLIVKSAVKDHAESMNVGGQFYDELNAEVSDLLADAMERAQANDRKTVQARDL
jgi:histone H3/H4